MPVNAIAMPNLLHVAITLSSRMEPKDLQGKETPKHIFISCGSKENPDRVKQAVDELKAAGYNATSHVSEGTAHEFLTWRRALKEFASILFK